MKTKTYIEKEGCIYGISSKFNNGWEHKLYVFTDEEEAEKWLHTEEYDFRERELCTKTRAIELMGESRFNEALEMIANGDADFM